MRQVQVQEIRKVIANGQVIEDYPNDKYSPSYLISGLTQAGRPIHVQCSYPSRLLARIITLYQPDPQKWDEDFTQRRNRGDDSRSRNDIISKVESFITEIDQRLNEKDNLNA